MDDLLRRIEAALSGRYEIEDELGRGGMAAVFRAQDVRHERVVAVKVLPPRFASAISSERFLYEIKLAAGLTHPYIVPILDSGEADGLLFYVMPLVPGETLASRLGREGPLALSDALAVGREIAEALAHAHDAGIVHRDVKPSNILLTREHALLSDFGIARAVRRRDEDLTGIGVVVGTPAYMSPQQALSDDELDGRADQYSLACVVYEMLVGRAPFTGPSPEAVLVRHATQPLPPLRDERPDVSPALASALERALSKQPIDRYPTMEAFRAALEGEAAGVSVGTSPLQRAGTVIALGLVAITAAWGVGRLYVGRITNRPDAVDRVAVLPCGVAAAADHPGDSLLSQNTARQVYWWLDRVGIVAVQPDRLENLAFTGVTALPRLADSLGVATLVGCSIEPLGGDSVQLEYHVWSDGQTRNFRLDMKRANPGLVEARRFAAVLAPDLLHLPTAGEDRFPGTDDADAFSRFLQGDHAFDAGHFFEAEGLFAAAYSKDPSFALARWRQADARRWQLEPADDDRPLSELYDHSSEELGARSELLLSAIALPPGPSFARFDTVLRELSSDWYAHLLYGDELLHRGPLFGFPLERAEEELRIATRLKPDFAPAWDHLAMALIREGKADAADTALHNLSAVSGPSPHDYPIPELWRHAWLETFHPDRVAAGRRALITDTAHLPVYARLVRYFDLPDLQLALGLLLVHSSSPGSMRWHSGTNAIALANASLGRPGMALETWRGAAEAAPTADTAEAWLFVRMWAVVPHALGLEGFSVDARALRELTTIVDDTSADALRRARAAWALALSAAHRRTLRDSADFVLHQRLVDDLTDTHGLDRRMSGDLDAVAAARQSDWRTALDASSTLVSYDSAGIVDRPFNRAAFHLQRGEWYAELARQTGDETFTDSARAAWIWFQNTDIEGIPERRVQAAEVDGALGVHARLRLARLAEAQDQPRAACDAARAVLNHWSEAAPGLDAVRDEARVIAGRRCLEE